MGSGVTTDHTYGVGGTYTVVLTVTDTDDGADSDTQNVNVSEAPQVTDQVAVGEIHVSGSASGEFSDTHSNDDITQDITEVESGGKPSKRYSYLEHKWFFDVQPGNLVTFYFNAWSDSSSDGDQFMFAYSTDDSEYINMLTVNATYDNGYQSYPLPPSTSGRVYVRVVDTNRTQGNRSLDTIYVDHIFIRTETASGSPPNPPSILTADAVSASQIELAWTDNSADEVGFEIERSPNGSSWEVIASVSANTTTYSDTGLSSGTTYHYQVRAYNLYGYSGYSNIDNATTHATGSVHVGSLVGSSNPGNRDRWDAEVTITVHDGAEALVSGATVTGVWSGGATGSASCTTNTQGWCQLEKRNIKADQGSVVFTVTDVTYSDYTYIPENNHDPGSAITIPKP
jgi:hypothetical protein